MAPRSWPSPPVLFSLGAQPIKLPTFLRLLKRCQSMTSRQAVSAVSWPRPVGQRHGEHLRGLGREPGIEFQDLGVEGRGQGALRSQRLAQPVLAGGSPLDLPPLVPCAATSEGRRGKHVAAEQYFSPTSLRASAPLGPLR